MPQNAPTEPSQSYFKDAVLPTIFELPEDIHITISSEDNSCWFEIKFGKTQIKSLSVISFFVIFPALRIGIQS